jgi:DNA-binding PadR family transcriptional regulator
VVSAPTAGIRDRERCDTLVLAALASANGDGYEVLARLQDGTRRGRRPSTQQVFTTLHRLHRNRLVARSANDPRRYRLTATGSRVLSTRTTAAEDFAGELHALQGTGR